MPSRIARRCSAFFLLYCAVFLSVITFFTLFHIQQENIISLIYQPAADCTKVERHAVAETSPIPPHYLLIPYREYAVRTSISCQAYKLDPTPKTHPKYSPYLRGAFPYVIPSNNITYADIEYFYTKLLISNNTAQRTRQTSFASNITFEFIPYRYENGLWSPVGIQSLQRTAILVPLQGREFHAKTLLLNLHAFARRQLLTYTVVIIEQVSEKRKKSNRIELASN